MNYSKLRDRHQLISAGLFTFLLFTFVGCSDEGEIQKLPQRNYELVWSDEFDGLASVSPDAAKWTFELGAGGWGNNEYEVYTNSTTNVSMDGKSNWAESSQKVYSRIPTDVSRRV